MNQDQSLGYIDHFCQIICVIFGFSVYLILSAPKTGEKNRLDVVLTKIFKKDISVSLKYDIGTLTIHCHHWLYLTIIGLCSYYFQFIHNTIPFFCIGGAVQGIFSYNDWYLVITRNKSKKAKKSFNSYIV